MLANRDVQSTEELTYTILQNVGPLNSTSQQAFFGEGATSFQCSGETNSQNISPHLRIIVEPERKFRYRYASDNGSHGVIHGDTTVPSKTSYPVVKLENVIPETAVVVKVSLYTADPNPKPHHVLKLVGSTCRDGVCYEELRDDMTASFNAIAIRTKTKGDIKAELLEAEISKYELKRQKYDKKHIEAHIAGIVKSINLKQSRLGFQAFYKDDLTQPLCETIFSQVIVDSKDRNNGEMRIIRMSSCTGKSTGGEEVILLCDKIEKKDVEVHFYEENGDFVGHGTFSLADVHHQVAIAFKTPEYKKNIESVVQICLYRKSDKKRGPPRDFHYIIDENDVSRKRKRVNSTENPIQRAEYFPGTSFCQGESVSQDKNLDYTLMDLSDILEDESISELLNTDIPSRNLPDISNINESSSESSDGFAKIYPQCLNIWNNTSKSTYTNNRNFSSTDEDIRNSDSLSMDAVVEPMSSLSIYEGNNNYYENRARNNKLENLREKICDFLGEEVDNTQLCDVPNLICIRDKNGNNLLHWAVMKHDEDLGLIYSMLEFAPRNIINGRNNSEDTPLHLAVQQNNRKILQLLLHFGADFNAVNKNGDNCFHIAAESNYIQCMTVLFPSLKSKKRPDFQPVINALNYDGLSPLHLSIIHNSKECMDLLLKMRADVNLSEKKCGRSPLHLAIEFQPTLICELLSQDLDLKAVDFRGYTPLQSVCDSKGLSFEKVSKEVETTESITQFLMNLNNKGTPLQWNVTEEELHSTDNSSSDSENDLDEQSDDDVYFDCCESIDSRVDEYLDSERGNTTNSYIFIEKELCKLLDESSWRKLGEVIGLTQEEMNWISELDAGLSPSKTILKKIKEVYNGENIINVLIALFQLAGLTEAVKLLEDNG